jgi:hypothetical protein
MPSDVPVRTSGMGDSMNISGPLMRLRLMVLVLPLMMGCGAQLRFVKIVDKTAPGPDGWQEACLKANTQNMTTGDSYVCALAIGMPIETKKNGYISPREAAYIAAECIEEAARYVIQPAPPESLSAIVCMKFKDEFDRILRERIRGSRVNLGCRPGIPETLVGF